MEPGTLLITLVIFGLISFVIEKMWGFNPYQAYAAIGAITITFSLIYIMWPILTNSTDINSVVVSTDRLAKWLVNFLPGALIGDVAGAIIAKFTGGFER